MADNFCIKCGTKLEGKYCTKCGTKNNDLNIQNNATKSVSKFQKLGALSSIKGKHVVGLSLPEGLNGYVHLFNTKIVFEIAGSIYNLPINKVKDISVKSDNDIQKAYVSSIGGAVAGGVLFGPLGAIIGGRTKEKTSITINYYLIFTYIKEGSTDYISFQVEGVNQIKALDFVKFYAKNKPISKKEINL
ncbi:hypothetical protein CLPUN_03010 [Clostridium puniceum]|uniref:Uncharacterized protein n=1 Tax=Clostridium puniceum TaxID=29367 RepID=A0A1S8TXL3_9CLOT|nr:zinc ribbon domain-containing protein [Clostridium puniceum]OOM82332.1 hypothetical protein CLPUN_03010 [Clostridium puniceum]